MKKRKQINLRIRKSLTYQVVTQLDYKIEDYLCSNLLNISRWYNYQLIGRLKRSV